jgi:hypothetical protein
MLAVLALCWPGIWRWDEIFTMNTVTVGNIDYWQHWLSSLYILVFLEIIPVPGGVLILQVALISLIVGDMVWKIYSRINSKLAYLMYIPLLLPAVIDSNLYPIRATPCAYIELWLVVQIMEIALLDKKCSFKRLIILGAVGGLVTSWRPENIIYIIGFPIILVATKRIKVKKLSGFLAAGLIVALLISGIQNKGLSEIVFSENSEGEITMQKEAYSLSGFITGLKSLTRGENFESDDKEADLKLIYECMDKEIFSVYGAMYTFWNGGLREVTPDKLAALRKVYLKLVVYNFPKFISSRWELFTRTNFSDGYQILIGASAHIYDYIGDDEPSYKDFRDRYICNRPLSSEVRSTVINILEGKTQSDIYVSSSEVMVKVFWNAFPVILFLIGILIYETLKKNFIWFWIIGCLLAKAAIVFLTAPDSYFMYYFSTYLVGNALFVFWIIKMILAHRKKFAIIQNPSV